MVHSALLCLVLLIALSQANGTPRCTKPSPPQSQLPTLQECLDVKSTIVAAASIQGGMPQVWSRAQPPQGGGVRLPMTFSFPGFQNSCEFAVDTVAEDSIDIFPTNQMAAAAAVLISECLTGNSNGALGLGQVLVGPRREIEMTLRKKLTPNLSTGRNKTVLAIKETELESKGIALHSAANLPSAE